MEPDRSTCPNCGALTIAGADWCTLCYTPLKGTEARPLPLDPASLPVPEGAKVRVPGAASEDPDTDGTSPSPVWACPACDHLNPLAATACEVCGTSFGKLFEEPVPAPDIDPRVAAICSFLPGLGQARCGRGGEGLARALATAWCLITGSMLLGSGVATLRAVGVVFLASGAGVWAVSAVDAYRLASGADELLTMRWLLWGFFATIAIFMVAVGAAFLSAAKP